MSRHGLTVGQHLSTPLDFEHSDCITELGLNSAPIELCRKLQWISRMQNQAVKPDSHFMTKKITMESLSAVASGCLNIVC